MKRAAVLIGVHKTGGGLPPLRAVGDCVSAMERWAKNQGIPSKSIASISDLTGEGVTISSIVDVVRKFGEEAVEQLVIYFAGHGFSGSMGDYWLLSDAPEDGNAAVNVYGSEFNARRGVFSHIVFISDACRLATKNIRDNAVRGSVIFPNLQIPGATKSIDQFFATLLGQPAFEIKIDGVYRSIYTATLVDALNGKYKNILEVDLPERATVLRPTPLKYFLPGEIGRRLQILNVELPEGSEPDAIITSQPTSWIAAFSPPLQVSSGPDASPPTNSDDTPPVEPNATSYEGFSARTDPFTETVDNLLLRRDLPPEASHFLAWMPLSNSQSVVGRDFDTNCGLRVIGADIQSVRDSLGSAVQLSESAVQVRANKSPASVLIELRSGNGVLVPAFPGYVGQLRFAEGGLLESLSYEPVQNSPGWGLFEEKASQIRSLRSEFNRAAQKKSPRLDNLSTKRATLLESGMRYQDGIDFTLAVLTAYAYITSHRDDLIPRLWARIVQALGAAPFDIEMFMPQGYPSLSAKLGMMPPFPVYAQGWAFMTALGRELPPMLETLQRHVESAPWTTVDPEGVGMISEFLDQNRDALTSMTDIADPLGGSFYSLTTTVDDILRAADLDQQKQTEEEEWGA
jgi:Caspase domain